MSNEPIHQIIYPVNRMVSEHEIRVQYSDAVANQECDNVGDWATQDLSAIMEALESSGQVTFSGAVWH
jgi:hypothetical protein